MPSATTRRDDALWSCLETAPARCQTLLRVLLADPHFAQACADLLGARRRQQAEDDRLHRAAVAACQDRIDVVLDMYLEVHRPDRLEAHRLDQWAARTARPGS